jgi:hypothetical protein
MRRGRVVRVLRSGFRAVNHRAGAASGFRGRNQFFERRNPAGSQAEEDKLPLHDLAVKREDFICSGTKINLENSD